MNLRNFETNILLNDEEIKEEITDKDKTSNALNELYYYLEDNFNNHGYFIYKSILNNKNEIVSILLHNNNITSPEDITYIKKQFDIIYRHLKRQAQDKQKAYENTIENITELILWGGLMIGVILILL